MLTAHEEQIKVAIISYKEGEEVLVASRLKRLHHFVEHLGFLVGALLNGDVEEISLFIEPHVCPCDHIPCKEKVTLVDIIAIEKFCSNSGLVVDEVISLEEHIKREGKHELAGIESSLNGLGINEYLGG